MSSNLPEKAHAELGASVAARWTACPGSVQLSRGRPTYETEHSRAGTAAHHVAEMCLTKGVDAEIYVGSEFEGIEVDEDMARAVQVYVDHCRSIAPAVFGPNPGYQCWIEKKFSLASLNPPGPMFGTSDFIAYDPDTETLYVVDYKNGSGVLVEAQGNIQLRYYALGAVLAVGAGLKIQRIVMTIVQPRAFHPLGVVRSDEMSYVDLLDFADELMEAARKTLEPDAPLVAGPHCRFCPASAICPAQRDHVQETAQLVFAEADESGPPAPQALTPAQLAHIAKHLPTLEQWANDVRTHIRRMLETGEVTPEQVGMKIVEGKARRSWASETQVGQWLTDVKGYADEEIETRKLKSPAQIEKLMGKDKKSIPNDFVKTERGLVMVPLSDKRDAVALAAPDVFEALPPGHE